MLHLSPRAEVGKFPAQFLSFGRKDHDRVLFQNTDIVEHGGREYDHLDPYGHRLEVSHQRTDPSEDAKAGFRDVGSLAKPVDLESTNERRAAGSAPAAGIKRGAVT